MARSTSSITTIAPTITAVPASALTVLPVKDGVAGEFRDQIDPTTLRFTKLAEMFSPDGSVVLPAYRAIRQGPTGFRGWRFSDPLDAYGFIAAAPGNRVFVSNRSEDKTYRGLLGENDAITPM